MNSFTIKLFRRNVLDLQIFIYYRFCSIYFSTEYSRLRNIGITDPIGETKSALKDHYDSDNLLFLTSGCINLTKFFSQLEMTIELDLSTNEYIDLTILMPNSFTIVEIYQLTSEKSIIKKIKSLGGEFVSNNFVISKELIKKINEQLEKFIQSYVEQVKFLNLGNYLKNII